MHICRTILFLRHFFEYAEGWKEIHIVTSYFTDSRIQCHWRVVPRGLGTVPASLQLLFVRKLFHILCYHPPFSIRASPPWIFEPSCPNILALASPSSLNPTFGESNYEDLRGAKSPN